MKFLFVIDPIERLKPESDSTIEIMQECADSDIEVFYSELNDLYFLDKGVYANATQIQLSDKKFKKIKKGQRPLDDFDLILMRKEPPYDLNYHYATMLLDKSKVLVFNNPQGLRDANEKLVILNFSDIIPKTLVSSDQKRILSFLDENDEVIVKPIHLFGGKGLITIKNTDKNKASQIKKITNNGMDYVLVQEFIKSVFKGDKRIMLLDGKPLGGIIRVPKKGNFRANLAQGGTAKKLVLKDEDFRIIKTIQPYLQKEGLLLAGIDIIGDKLIEINVTCPTGLVPIKKFDKRNITKDIVDFLIKKARK